MAGVRLDGTHLIAVGMGEMLGQAVAHVILLDQLDGDQRRVLLPWDKKARGPMNRRSKPVTQKRCETTEHKMHSI